MAQGVVRVKSAWTTPFLRHISNGRAKSLALRLSNCGLSRFNQEIRKNPEFEAEFYAAQAEGDARRQRRRGY